MLVGFALLTKGTLFVTGFVNQVLTCAFCKKLSSKEVETKKQTMEG